LIAPHTDPDLAKGVFDKSWLREVDKSRWKWSRFRAAEWLWCGLTYLKLQSLCSEHLTAPKKRPSYLTAFQF